MSNSIVYVFSSVYNELWRTYSNIAMFMVEDNYDEDKVIEALRVINKMEFYSREEQKELLTLIYKILKTTAGIIFLRENKEFALCAVRKAEEFTETVCYSSSKIDTELTKAIAEFFVKNDGVFCDHGFHDIDYPLYEDIYRCALKEENEESDSD
jgi:hypothetical protein